MIHAHAKEAARALRLGVLLASAALAALVLTSAARAEFGIVPGTTIGKAHEPIHLIYNPPCTPKDECPPAERYEVDTSTILAAKPVSQAGAHPDGSGGGDLAGVGKFAVKDFFLKTPPGFLGNPTVVKPCSRAAFHATYQAASLPAERCPIDSEVGVATVKIGEAGRRFSTSPVYRLTASPGYPATFGLTVGNLPIVVNANLRTDEDYGLLLSSRDIPGTISLEGAAVTLWGVPASPVHNPDRWDREKFTPDLFFPPSHCEEIEPDSNIYLACFGNWGASSGLEEVPFLQTPTDCNAQRLLTTVTIDSWQQPGVFLPQSLPPGDPRRSDYEIPTPTPTGCEKLHFEPWIGLLPSTKSSDSPTGVSVQMEISLHPETLELATPQLKKAIVTLPEGMSLNPAAADGRQGCSSTQIGLLTAHGSYPNPIRFKTGDAECPQASKVGTVGIETPLLEERLDGDVYLATPYDNPFHSLFALYAVIRGPGFTVKLPGRVEPNPVTGQLTTTFAYVPQLPFEHLRMNFFGGPRAPLATSPVCGVQTIATELEPWSAPQSGPPATPENRYTASEGPAGVRCSYSLASRPFSPTMLAGSSNPLAGHTTSFELRLRRPDGHQELAGLTVKTPAGFVAYIRGVPYCSDQAIEVAATRTGEYEAAHPDCPSQSEVGTLLSGVGAGPSPYFIPGKVYLAGPYKGGQLSLVAITPALAGGTPGHPLFDLGTVVVRVAVHIDPVTARITAISDPIPQILDGIPLRVKDIRVLLDRPGWAFNPTSCDPMAIEAQVVGQSGAEASLSNHFQVTNCAALSFKPKFTVSTSGRTSRANGASLTVRLTYPKAPAGTQANLAKAKVSLPKQLPSRLTTLQKACPDKVFNENPAACPVASRVGTAVVHTPVLPVPLEGPAYFVSHGGEEFPNLIMVLQGYGVTIDLVGDTFIKHGVTSSTFRATPDVPFESFELTLPQGPYSALAANGNLCKVKGGLEMPTAFVAQNGMQIKQTTKIGVSGCVKPKANKRAGRRKR